MAKKSLQEQYSQHMGDLERSAFIEVVQQNPRATLGEIVELIGGDPKPGGVDLLEVTVEEICGNVRSVKKNRKPGPKKGGTQKRSGGGPETRSQVGRDKLDKMVLNRLKISKKKRWSSKELRKLTGASEHQLRAALTRLIEAGKANWEGSTSQTRYFAA